MQAIQVKIDRLGGVPSFDLTLACSDVAGKRLETTAQYLEPEGQYRGLTISLPKSAALSGP